MSGFSEWAADRIAQTHRNGVEPMPLDAFWDLVEHLDWASHGAQPETVLATARARLTFDEALQAHVRAGRLVSASWRGAGIGRMGVTESLGMRQVIAHVIGLGRATYDREAHDLPMLRAREERGEVFDAFLSIFAPQTWTAALTDEEMEAYLQRTVTPSAPSSGVRQLDCARSEEHGMGLLVWDEAYTVQFMTFKNAVFTRKRRTDVREQLARYKGDDFVTLTLCGEGDHWELFEIGVKSDLFYSVASEAEARERLAERLQFYAEEGYVAEDRPTVPMVVEVPRGLGHTQVQRSAFEVIDFSLPQHEPVSVFSGRYRVSRDATHFWFRTTEPSSAALALNAFFLRHPTGPLPKPRVACLEEDGPRVIFPFGDSSPMDLDALHPVDQGSQPTPDYFSKTTLYPDDDTPRWAAQAARSAVVLARSHDIELGADVAQLDALVAALAHTPGMDVEPHAAKLGAWLGETLRAQLGGAWGRVRIFSDLAPDPAIQIGAAEILFWPIREVRERLRGTSTVALAERASTVLESASAAPSAPEARRYRLAADQGYFDAGALPDGTQVLMAAFHPNTFGLFFDAEGALLAFESRATPAELAEGQAYPPSVTGTAASVSSRESGRLALDAWQKEMGFTPRTIQVQRFTVAEQGVGIEDLPGHYQELLADPGSEPNAIERALQLKSARQWVEQGCFVLYWGNDLWLDGEGSVTSS